jgi:hypothetical protein
MLQIGGSEPCSKNELDLFTIPPTQTRKDFMMILMHTIALTLRM